MDRLRLLIQGALRYVDRHYHRLHDLRDVGPVLHVGRERHRGPAIHFPDRTVLEAGDAVGTLHFNNDRFTSGGTGYEAETNWGGSVRARLGYAFDRTLIYATGGCAFTRAELENKDTGVREKDTAHGWTIGAGVEQAITDTVAGRLEYRYTDYRNSDIFNAAGRDGDLDSHSIMLGVSMKF